MQKKRRRGAALLCALLCALLLPLQSAHALFGREKENIRADEGAPVAENMELRVYRGVAAVGQFRAKMTGEGTPVFEIVTPPKKGTLAITEDGLGFVYTPGGKTGADSFTYTASDEAGNTSLPATVRITIVRAACGVRYDDMDGNAAHTAAVDLAEHGVFVGTKIGESMFFEPERTLARGEFVSMALAAMALDAQRVTMTGFCDDAEIPAWAKGSAVSALNAGVITGVATDEGIAYRANDTITLGEAAVVLNRLLRVADVSMPEFGESEAWCAQAVANLQAVSVLEAGSFPGEAMRAPLTRAQAAELLSAAMALGEKEERGLLAGLLG